MGVSSAEEPVTTSKTAVHPPRYARSGAAAEYAQKILGLELVRREGSAVYLRGDDRDHTLVYVKWDPADHTVGWEVADAAALDAAGAALRRTASRCGPARAARRNPPRRGLPHFVDPSGNTHDLVGAAAHSGRRYFAARDCGGGASTSACAPPAARDEGRSGRRC
jgi:2,3-dihydroxy-p-cumate/2,3-dihydroxybenzoate 3,4-dioxygenase